MPIAALTHVALACDDLEAAERLYRALLGLRAGAQQLLVHDVPPGPPGA